MDQIHTLNRMFVLTSRQLALHAPEDAATSMGMTEDDRDWVRERSIPELEKLCSSAVVMFAPRMRLGTWTGLIKATGATKDELRTLNRVFVLTARELALTAPDEAATRMGLNDDDLAWVRRLSIPEIETVCSSTVVTFAPRVRLAAWTRLVEPAVVTAVVAEGCDD